MDNNRCAVIFALIVDNGLGYCITTWKHIYLYIRIYSNSNISIFKFFAIKTTFLPEYYYLQLFLIITF